MNEISASILALSKRARQGDEQWLATVWPDGRRWKVALIELLFRFWAHVHCQAEARRRLPCAGRPGERKAAHATSRPGASCLGRHLATEGNSLATVKSSRRKPPTGACDMRHILSFGRQHLLLLGRTKQPTRCSLSQRHSFRRQQRIPSLQASGQHGQRQS
jgi:hypothetical protein